MNTTDVCTLDYYDRTVSQCIMEKYGMSEKQALQRFISSETYKMLADPELEMWDFSPLGIFDIWEAEQVTGDPRNSLYIRRE